MHTANEAGLSARIRCLPPVVPDGAARSRVLAAMAAALEQESRHDRRTARRQELHALAAGLAAVIVIAVLLGLAVTGGPLRAPAGPASATPSLAAAPVAAGPGAVEPLIEASWLLEHALEALPRPRRVMRADTASTIVALETRLAAIDAELGSVPEGAIDPAVREALWRDRVNVMAALYQVRFAQSRTFSF